MSTINLKNTVEQTQTTYSVSHELIITFPNRLKTHYGLVFILHKSLGYFLNSKAENNHPNHKCRKLSKKSGFLECLKDSVTT